MADNTAAIAAIDTILNTGATDVEVDGQRVKYDQAQLRKQRAILAAADDTLKSKRPVASTINLSGI